MVRLKGPLSPMPPVLPFGWHGPRSVHNSKAVILTLKLFGAWIAPPSRRPVRKVRWLSGDGGGDHQYPGQPTYISPKAAASSMQRMVGLHWRPSKDHSRYQCQKSPTLDFGSDLGSIRTIAPQTIYGIGFAGIFRREEIPLVGISSFL